jgi:hypothetical protein
MILNWLSAQLSCVLLRFQGNGRSAQFSAFAQTDRIVKFNGIEEVGELATVGETDFANFIPYSARS